MRYVGKQCAEGHDHGNTHVGCHAKQCVGKGAPLELRLGATNDDEISTLQRAFGDGERGVRPRDSATAGLGQLDRRADGGEVEEFLGIDRGERRCAPGLLEVFGGGRGGIASIVPTGECHHHDGVPRRPALVPIEMCVGFPAPCPPRTHRRQAQDLQAIVDAPDSVLLIARDELDDDRIVGSLTLAMFRIPTGYRAWIEDVVVDGAVRGRGIGDTLNRVALDRAREAGATTCGSDHEVAVVKMEVGFFGEWIFVDAVEAMGVDR
ncbi:hypothetical protein GQR58_029230 [Nymphon striatum]|nr:hypothetical protein GQR58_029230 [Nymphon striatum]